MQRAFEICISILNREFTFNEFGITLTFSLLQVIISCIVLGLFFRIFYAIYDR